MIRATLMIQSQHATERQLRRVERLLRDRKFRDTQQQFVVEGVANFLRLVTCGFSISAVLRSRALLKNGACRKALADLQKKGVTVTSLSPEQFRSVGRLKHASGILAIAQQHRPAIAELVPVRCCLAVSHVRSRGNFGTLVRSAAAFGADGIILIGQSVDPHDPDVIRSSMGTSFQIPFYRTSWPGFSDWTQRRQISVIGGCPSAAQDVANTDLTGPVVFMLGDERKGLSSRQRKHCHQFANIPMADGIDSLNLGVAGSLLAYEHQRQRSRSAASAEQTSPRQSG